MSVEAIAWVKKQKVGDHIAKLLLITIADYANSEWKCWPSQKLLAEEAEVTTRTVRTKLVYLEEKGFITRTARGSSQGGRSTDLIHMMKPEAPSGRKGEPGEGLAEAAASGGTVKNKGPSSATPPREEPAAPRMTTIPPPGDPVYEEPAAPRFQPLIKFYFDKAKALSRYVPQAHAPILARSVKLAVEAGVSEKDVEGGITLMLEKGFGPETLARFIAEYQATRKPVPAKETGEGSWDQDPELLTVEENARRAAAFLASTAGSHPTAESASGTETFLPSTPTTSGDSE